MTATDAYGLPLTYGLLTNPTLGMLSAIDAASGAFTYTPATGFVGSDSFAWQATNGHAKSTGSVNISVTAAGGSGSSGSGKGGGGFGLLGLSVLTATLGWRRHRHARILV